MGIADYGMSSNGPYEYSTTAVWGHMSIASLQTQNSTGNPYVGFQLNVDLVFSDDNSSRVYWIQNVVQIDTSTDYAFFLDNIWNSSSRTATMVGSGISGSGQVTTHVIEQNYYYDRANEFGIGLPIPASLSLLVTTSVNSLGQPTVTFEFDTGSGFQSYDVVTFTISGRLSSFTGFEVNGFDYNPYGVFYDSELVMAGACCGYNTTDVQSDVGLALYYWNGHNYQTVPSAYNFGSDTAEGADNVDAEGYYYFSNGTLFSEVRPGSGSLGELYDQSQTGTIDIRTSAGSGTLYVANATGSTATPAQYQFVGGEVTVSLSPGTYTLQIYRNDTIYDQGTETVGAGQTLTLQTPLSDVHVTMSYSVAGGGVGFAPVLTYFNGGVQVEANLTGSPTTYYMDPGTAWHATGNLTRGAERWVTLGSVSGTASSYQTVQLSYYHQYLATFSYAISGGGGGSSTPTVEYVQFGSTKTSPFNVPLWADAASTYMVDSPLPGSTSTERWVTPYETNQVSMPGTIGLRYYHQFSFAASYSLVGGGSPSPPTLTGTELGAPFSVSLQRQSEASWLDSGTQWSIANPLEGSTPQERWESNSTTVGAVSGASAVSFEYYHQYAVTLSYSIVGGGNPPAPEVSGERFGMNFLARVSNNSTAYLLDSGSNWTLPGLLLGNSTTERWRAANDTTGPVSGQSRVQIDYQHQFFARTNPETSVGGSITNVTGWYDSGTKLRLSASANIGWEFEGWTGSGTGAYSGLLNQTSIQADGPLAENATFYPGLEIEAGTEGSVNYGFSAQAGTIQAGESRTVYAPMGTVVNLSADPSSFFTQFSGWTPASLGNSGQATLMLESPISVKASFSLNLLVIGGAVGAIGVIAAVAVLALRKGRKR